MPAQSSRRTKSARAPRESRPAGWGRSRFTTARSSSAFRCGLRRATSTGSISEKHEGHKGYQGHKGSALAESAHTRKCNEDSKTRRGHEEESVGNGSAPESV